MKYYEKALKGKYAVQVSVPLRGYFFEMRLSKAKRVRREYVSVPLRGYFFEIAVEEGRHRAEEEAGFRPLTGIFF